VNHIFLVFICLIYITSSVAQDVSVDIISSSNIKSDTSYYAASRFNDTSFIITGEYGIIQIMNNEGIVYKTINSNTSKDIFDICCIGNRQFIASGDSGTIIHINNETASNSAIYKHKKSCLYSITNHNNDIYISGGNSKLARGVKAVPKGFILKSSDYGVTFKTIKSNLLFMIWDIYYDSLSNSVLYSKYFPNKRNF